MALREGRCGAGTGPAEVGSGERRAVEAGEETSSHSAQHGKMDSVECRFDFEE
jgi:hypothetical protein